VNFTVHAVVGDIGRAQSSSAGAGRRAVSRNSEESALSVIANAFGLGVKSFLFARRAKVMWEKDSDQGQAGPPSDTQAGSGGIKLEQIIFGKCQTREQMGAKPC
jgi:hypothetical protein